METPTETVALIISAQTAAPGLLSMGEDDAVDVPTAPKRPRADDGGGDGSDSGEHSADCDLELDGVASPARRRVCHSSVASFLPASHHVASAESADAGMADPVVDVVAGSETVEVAKTESPQPSASSRRKGLADEPGCDVHGADGPLPVDYFQDRLDEMPSQGDVAVYRYFRALPRSLCLSRLDKGRTIQLSNDDLTASNPSGYRMVRATMGSPCGFGYFEVRFDSDSGALRVGISTGKGDLEAPCGYDSHSVAYGSKHGNKYLQSLGSTYGPSWGCRGAVVGVLVRLPPWTDVPQRELRDDGTRVIRGRKTIVMEEDEVYGPTRPSSSVEFFLNGMALGVAFSNLRHVTWYPAVSLYNGAVATVNFGPDFAYSMPAPVLPWRALVHQNPAFVKLLPPELPASR